jgi:hypothetical protein
MGSDSLTVVARLNTCKHAVAILSRAREQAEFRLFP